MRSRSAPVSSDDSMQLSIINAFQNQRKLSPHFPTPGQSPKPYRNAQPPNKSCPIFSRTDKWKKKWLTPKNPCFYCGKAGHWAPNCPAWKKAANARLSSLQWKVNVASISAIPALEYNEALLELGETHSVLGNISLFTTMQKTEITLLVASSHQFMVDVIRDITLKTLKGQLILKNILLFPEIKGVFLLVGKTISQDMLVKLLNNDFHV
ncbi:hypothetical protein O181_133140 [Austropuccinia psidii MF-1]|uniref:CCHC-type domain-containing protein n=1 Tax=Austropuccinia psidii MF-1 TaxID=1389203 RepID=A0A9Q3L7T0_9BASI|nr:hypothetical protein [Austropuccinia psidii MF-1]